VIPLSDDNPLLRTPIVTILLLLLIAAAWIFVQGAGLDDNVLAATVCNLGMVAGEITHGAPLGTAVPLGHGMACVVDAEPINYLTPLTSMFLHGGWMHILGNSLFLWVFGKAVEDSMGHLRFLAFYLLCGLVAAAAQIAIDPTSPVPMVGASGAISGVMGAYVVLYPRVRVNTLVIFVIFFRILALPAWLVLLYWFGLQVVKALPQVAGVETAAGSGVAVMAHVGGFLAGALLVKLFENERLVAERLGVLLVSRAEG
jgi:membrane associated rhomboid family serine protease